MSLAPGADVSGMGGNDLSGVSVRARADVREPAGSNNGRHRRRQPLTRSERKLVLNRGDVDSPWKILGFILGGIAFLALIAVSHDADGWDGELLFAVGPMGGLFALGSVWLRGPIRIVCRRAAVTIVGLLGVGLMTAESPMLERTAGAYSLAGRGFQIGVVLLVVAWFLKLLRRGSATRLLVFVVASLLKALRGKRAEVTKQTESPERSRG